MAKLVKIKTPVNIRFKELKNGNKSVYLDIYRNGKRAYEFLKLYIVPGKDPASRANNENVMNAAVAAQAKRIREIAEGVGEISTHSAKMTVRELVQRYIDYRESAGRITQNFKLLFYCLNDELGNVRIKDVDNNWFHKYITYLKTHKSERYNKKLSSTTIRMRVTTMQETLRYAARNKWITANVSLMVDPEDRVKNNDHTRQYLTRDEIKQLIEAPCKRPEIKMMFLFSVFTGLRLSDIQTLKRSDIIQSESGWAINKKMIKQNKYVTVPLSVTALKFIDLNKKPGELMFEKHDRSFVHYIVVQWINEQNLDKHISFHCARHTFATLSLTMGADLYTVSKLLGHADIKTTQVYAKIIDEKKVEAVNLLDKI